MSDGYSNSLEGIRIAEQSLDRAAQRIAAGWSAGDSARKQTVTARSSAPPVDLAAEMVTVIEAKIGVEANLKVTGTQRQLDRSILDLFA
jgi:hypothetical protein